MTRPLPDVNEAFIIRGLDESGVSFVGREAVRAFRDAVDALTGSALEHGGWHEDAVTDLVFDACRTGRAKGDEAAVAHIEQALGSGLRTWRVGERIDAVVFGRLD